MVITPDYLRYYFNKFNTEYFDGRLSGAVNFEITNSKHKLGMFCCSKRNSFLLKRPRPSDCVIKISKYYDISERIIHNILLHEMIHYYIISSGIHDTSSHGNIFRWHMIRLNSLGCEISIRADIMEWKAADSNVKSEYIVMAVELDNGKNILSVVNPNYREKIDLDARRWIGNYAKSIGWFKTHDQYFCSFRKVRTFRGIYVDRCTFEEKCREMTPI